MSFMSQEIQDELNTANGYLYSSSSRGYVREVYTQTLVNEERDNGTASADNSSNHDPDCYSVVRTQSALERNLSHPLYQ